MPLATYQSLCIDAVDPARMQPFWARLLGLEEHVREDGISYLEGPTPQHRVWVNEVPEPVTVKQRVHLDVHVGATADALALGATPLDTESFGWDVLRDPEGGEFCAFTRDVVPPYRLYEIGIDSARPLEIAAWWAEVFGVPAVETQQHGEAYAYLEGVPGMPFESLDFVPVPEPKTVKNRIHWDVDTTSIEALVAHGATVLREPDRDISWHLMADPEGNEFCAFLPE